MIVHPQDLASPSERSRSTVVDVVAFLILFLVSVPLVNQWLARFDRAEFTVLWMIFFAVGYENIPVCLWGQSLGHRVYGLKLVDARGNKPGVRPILYRWILRVMYSGNWNRNRELPDEASGIYLVRARRP